MKFTFAFLALAPALALASNHFKGLTASNYIGGSSPAKCRTAAEVRSLFG